MSAGKDFALAPHVVLIDGRLYGSGVTRDEAVADFSAQTVGATLAMQANMAGRAKIAAVSEDHASEIAEMRAATAIGWPEPPCQGLAPSDEEEDRRFLNHYDCPCGTSWSTEDDCTCDDRCPDCRTSCTPTWSEDTSGWDEGASS